MEGWRNFFPTCFNVIFIFQAQAAKATPAPATSAKNESVTPLEVHDFSDAEAAMKRFEEIKPTNPDYANMTFDEARQHFEQFKSDSGDIPPSMTFEEALLKHNFGNGSFRVKRGISFDVIKESIPKQLLPKLPTAKFSFARPTPPPQQPDDTVVKINQAPFVFIAVSSSLGLLASLVLCCKSFCCKH